MTPDMAGASAPANLLAEFSKLEMKATAAGVRREDGRTAAEIEVELSKER